MQSIFENFRILKISKFDFIGFMVLKEILDFSQQNMNKFMFRKMIFLEIHELSIIFKCICKYCFSHYLVLNCIHEEAIIRTYSSASLTGGNQVDGLPPVRNISNWARVGPRTPVLSTMKMMFWRELSSINSLESDMIILDNVLKLWIELIKYRNHNVGGKSYLMQTSLKV